MTDGTPLPDGVRAVPEEGDNMVPVPVLPRAKVELALKDGRLLPDGVRAVPVEGEIMVPVPVLPRAKVELALKDGRLLPDGTGPVPEEAGTIDPVPVPPNDLVELVLKVDTPPDGETDPDGLNERLPVGRGIVLFEEGLILPVEATDLETKPVLPPVPVGLTEGAVAVGQLPWTVAVEVPESVV